jgi:hypothetical protein
MQFHIHEIEIDEFPSDDSLPARLNRQLPPSLSSIRSEIKRIISSIEIVTLGSPMIEAFLLAEKRFKSMLDDA